MQLRGDAFAFMQIWKGLWTMEPTQKEGDTDTGGGYFPGLL